MARPIKTVSFDLWDTVFIDDSDEPKRAAAGLPTKAIQRRILVQQFLERHSAISREQVDRCYDTADAAFRGPPGVKYVRAAQAERIIFSPHRARRHLSGNLNSTLHIEKGLHGPTD